MAPYFELGRSLGSIEVRRLNAGDKIAGEVGGKETVIRILDRDTLTIQRKEGPQTLEKESGSLIFDKPKGLFTSQHGIVYLDLEDTERLRRLRVEFENNVPGALQDSYRSLWEKMETDVGIRTPGRRNFWEKLIDKLSAGRTKDFL